MTLKDIKYYINLYKNNNIDDYNVLEKIVSKNEKIRYIKLSKKMINSKIDKEREVEPRKALREKIKWLEMNEDLLNRNWDKNANKPKTNRNSVKSLTNSKNRNFKNKEV